MIIERWMIWQRTADGYAVVYPADAVPDAFEFDGWERIEVVPAAQLAGAVAENEKMREAIRAALNGAPLDDDGRFKNERYEAIYRAIGGGSRAPE